MNRRDFIVGTAALAGSVSLPVSAAVEPNLRVGVLSDIHLTPKGKVAQEMFRKALLGFRERHVDAVLVTGDLAIGGTLAELEVTARIWNEVFPDDRMPDGAKVEKLFLTGNHDTDGWVYMHFRFPTLEEAKANSLFYDIEKKWRRLFGLDYAPVVMKSVKGYPFVLMNWVCEIGNEAKWSEYAKASGIRNAPHPLSDWFRANEAKLPKDRPFFFAQHKHPKGSCSSPWADDPDPISGELLKKYPNCVALSGHTHTSILEERTIWQGEYTSVGCGSLCGYAFTRDGRENGHSNDGREQFNEMAQLPYMKCHQGLMMEVFGDRIVFERLDYEHEGIAKGAPDWVVPLDASRRPYRQEPRAAAAPAPQFAADAKVSIREIEKGKARQGEEHRQVEVVFPPVNGLAGGIRAYDYQVDCLLEVEDVKRVAASSRVYSPNILQPAKYDVEPVLCRFDRRKLPKGRLVRFAVTPVNEWGTAGRTIVSDPFRV